MNDWDIPEHWDANEAEMWDDFVELDPRLGEDDYAQVMYHEAFFDLDMSPDDRDRYYNDLQSYLEGNYDIDFAEVFDWEDYREWYEAA
jgi:hypothetical protein